VFTNALTTLYGRDVGLRVKVHEDFLKSASIWSESYQLLLII